MEASEGIKQYASEKVAKIQKYLRSPLEAEVTIASEKLDQKVEINLVADGHKYVAHDTQTDMYAAIDTATDKLLRQVRDASDLRGQHRD